MSARLGVVLSLFLSACCGNSTGGSPTGTGSTPAPAKTQIAATDVAGSAADAKKGAEARAAKGGALVSAKLGGSKTFCVGVAWKQPTTTTRAIGVTLAGPVSQVKTLRVDPGPSAAVCLENGAAGFAKGSYQMTVSHAPSVAAGANEWEKLPAVSVALE